MRYFSAKNIHVVKVYFNQTTLLELLPEVRRAINKCIIYGDDFIIASDLIPINIAC